ncbi:MBL fold metallo-hydrolase [Sporocytophaga myxococcoides]|uniref:MBL fold metallo-hydrolase n=1 Tax=Sporocytophaga myxococcoides TaxID=153721 RepID=UPI0003FD5D99|nr:MBL fold metallo-hydrolase [Sporocytophaga myxococcoides]
MKLFVTSLNSGSNGNCYYIGNEKEAILVDAGISCREIEQRMKRLELSMKKVKALFISHEHTDHIKGLRVLSKKHQIPVYFTSGTLSNANLDDSNPHYVLLTPEKPVIVGQLEITAFPKFHDARDPQSFVIRYKDLCVGVFTDIGMVCENVIRYFKCCNAVFLEANYDEKMLIDGNYPYFLKKRISSNVGHLSNTQAMELFQAHRSENMSHLFLSHLSKENNSPELVKELFEKHAEGVEIVIASRTQEIPVYEIGKTNSARRENYQQQALEF